MAHCTIQFPSVRLDDSPRFYNRIFLFPCDLFAQSLLLFFLVEINSRANPRSINFYGAGVVASRDFSHRTCWSSNGDSYHKNFPFTLSQSIWISGNLVWVLLHRRKQKPDTRKWISSLRDPAAAALGAYQVEQGARDHLWMVSINRGSRTRCFMKQKAEGWNASVGNGNEERLST